MSTSTRPVSLALALLSLALNACATPDPSLAVVENAYPIPGSPAEQTTVYKAWWSVTEFTDPVAAGHSSDDERVVPASDYAYLLLAPGWDPASTQPPPRLLVARTKTKLSVKRGERLHIVVDDSTVDGSCTAGMPLSQEDADLITQRIFPGSFAGLRYDAATCTTTVEPSNDDAATGRPSVQTLRGGLDAQ
jgi:hypothetical protein